MKLSNALTIIALSAGLLGWSNILAQAPTQKTTTPAAKETTIKPGDGSVHKKSKPVKKPTSTNGNIGMSDGSVHFKDSQNPVNTATKKKKKGTKPTPKPKPTFGGINDGTSNTMMKTESTSKKKKNSKPGFGGISDGSSNTIVIGETTTTPKEEPKPTKRTSPSKRSTLKSQPVNGVKKKE